MLIPEKMPVGLWVSGVVPVVFAVSLALVIHQHRWAREVFVDCLRPSLLGNLLGLGAAESRRFCIAVA